MAIIEGNTADQTASGGAGTGSILPEGTGDLFSAIERVELALARLEDVVARREAEEQAAAAGQERATLAELSELKSRHRKLRERVSEELQQLDLLLSSLPQ